MLLLRALSVFQWLERESFSFGHFQTGNCALTVCRFAVIVAMIELQICPLPGEKNLIAKKLRVVSLTASGVYDSRCLRSLDRHANRCK